MNEAKQYIADVKAEGWCEDCLKEYPPECYDFDHRDARQKTANISQMAKRGASIADIEKEIAGGRNLSQVEVEKALDAFPRFLGLPRSCKSEESEEGSDHSSDSSVCLERPRSEEPNLQDVHDLV